MSVSERLRRLDNRVLRIDEREAKLATEEGWRAQAARWRITAAFAAVFIGTGYVTSVLGPHVFHGFILFGGILAFQAGAMKAEDDRLHRRGRLERLRPPGL